MSKEYDKIYQDKLNSLKQSILGNEITAELAVRGMSNSKLDKLCKEAAAIMGKEVYNDYNFRVGKILGLLRSIAFNAKHWDKLFELTGLNKAYVDIYHRVVGQTPYEKDGVFKIGKQMDIEGTKNLVMAVCATMNIVIEESDLSDITQERWNNIYNNALENSVKTMEFNAQNKQNMPAEYSDE